MSQHQAHLETLPRSVQFCLGLAAVALTALGSAVFVPTRLALLPAAAHDCALPLSRVTALVEAAAVLSMVGGMALVVQLAPAPAGPGWPAALQALAALGLLAVLAAGGARFVSDVRRPAALRQALGGFFRDGRRILADRQARTALLGLALLRGLVAVAVGALIAAVLARSGSEARTAFPLLLQVALLTMAGAGLGSVLAGLPRNPWWGGVPLGALGMALALAWVAQAPGVPLPLCLLVGLLGALVNLPLLVSYQQTIPDDARGNGMALLNTAGYLSMAVLSLLMAGLSALRWVNASGQLACVAGLAGAAAATAWRSLARPQKHGPTP